ncbi:MAG: DNA repair protein RecO [Patescibacteria group bacterium]|nr:DNA repair protein RecO [Patescibacteria group bacterium]
MTYKTEAIILGSFDVKEYDRVYTVLSKERGKMLVLGIGTRKPKAKLASGLEPITKSEIFCIKGRQLDRVAGVIINNQYPNLKKTLEELVSVRKCLKIIEDILPENEAFAEVYETLDIFLKKIDKSHISKKRLNQDQKTSISLLRVAAIWKAVHYAGYKPRVFHCISCGKRIISGEKYKFIIPDGILCQDCRFRNPGLCIELSEDVVKILRIFLYKKPDIVEKIHTRPLVTRKLERISVLFLQHILNKKVHF